MDVFKFTHEACRQYVETLLWSELDPDGEPLDETYSPEDMSTEALGTILREVADFVIGNWGDLEGTDPSQCGHDFVMSRNGHGTGFWARGMGEMGDRLHAAAESHGTFNAWALADGKVYVG